MLLTMIFLPVLTAAIIMMFKDKQEIPRRLALLTSLFLLFLGCLAIGGFDGTSGDFQYVMKFPWFAQMGINFHLGIDGISFPLLLLTLVLTPLVILFSWHQEKRPALYFALFMIIEAGVIGVFSSLDFILFFVFWEIVLIPMFFVIGIWGGERKVYASFKFLIYTHIASLLLLIGIFAMHLHGSEILGYKTFSIVELTEVPFSLAFQKMWFPILFIAFAVKIPIVPFHTWLPDAHVEAPTGGSAVLAGVMLKMGTYGMLRIAYLMNPDVTAAYAIPVITLGLMNVIYGALVALRQDDLKKMIAYSSISHMGFVLLGIQTGTIFGLKGAVFQMVAHGLISAALFMSCGMLQYATGTRKISLLQGIYQKMPYGISLMVLAFFASMGLPGFAGFIGEYTVLLGFFEAYGFWVIVLGLGIIIPVAFYLWAFQRVAYGYTPKSFIEVKDAPVNELATIFILMALVIYFGLLPDSLFGIIDGKILSILAS